MFMFAPLAISSSRRCLTASPGRAENESAGIQLAPAAKMRWPLTAKTKDREGSGSSSSGAWISSTRRKPIRSDRRSSTRPSTSRTARCTVYNGCSPRPAGHHSSNSPAARRTSSMPSHPAATCLLTTVLPDGSSRRRLTSDASDPTVVQLTKTVADRSACTVASG